MDMFYAITIQWPTSRGLVTANAYGTATATDESDLFKAARDLVISRNGAPHDANVTAYYAAPTRIGGDR